MAKKAAASRRRKTPKKTGVIKKLVAKDAPSHPTFKELSCPFYVEYQEDGQHVDSATFATQEECEDWLSLLYNVEAT